MSRRIAAVLAIAWLFASGSGAGMAAAHGRAGKANPEALPPNLIVDGMLQPLVADMFERSPSFRQQCRGIGAARHVRVFVQPVFGRGALSSRARATIRRFSHGAVIAVVSLPLPNRRDDAMELIAHEVEHVIEQLERVDLAALAEARAGASRLADGAFETDRARRAGRRVAAEAAGVAAATARAGTAARADAATR